MRKKINSQQITDIISNVLQDTENIIPSVMRKTYSFKGRKSPEVIAKVLNVFTNPDDTILDPFIGSGTTIIGSQLAKRKLIGTELDQFTYSIDKVLFEKVDYQELKNVLKKVEDDSKDYILDLYETECCGQKNYIKKVLFDPQNGKDGYLYPEANREIKNGKNIKLLFKCPICGNFDKQFTEDDWQRIQEQEDLSVEDFPKDRLLENSRINITRSTGADRYDTFFTHRNKLALLALQKAISALAPSKSKDFLQFCLVSSLSLAKIAMYGSSTDILYHVVLEKAQDMNVWYLFEQKVKSFLKFQKEYKDILVTDFSESENYSIIHSDYASYLKENMGLKVGAIFTDFPYTDQVPYFERNQLFRVWLEHFSDRGDLFQLTEEMLEQEIVVTNAPKRKTKNWERYVFDLDVMFKQFSDVLYEGAPVILFTKLGKKKYFNVFTKIVDLARKNGFEYVSRTSVEKKDPTLRKQSAFRNTLINEVIIVFQKLKKEKQYLYVNDENYENKIIDMVYNTVKNLKDNSITFTELIYIISEDVRRSGEHITSQIVNRIKQVIEQNFYISDNQEVQLSKKILYLDQEDNSTLFKKLYELVPTYVEKLLKSKEKFVLEDLYLELIDELSDGNNQTFLDIINDDKNIKEISSLVADKTDIDGDFYVKKSLPHNINYNAIDVATMDPYDFEDLCKQLFEKEGFVNVHRKGGSGDMGVDVVAQQFNGNTKDFWLIQCKRWVGNVDATPLQRLVSERERLGAQQIACYTTSDYTKDAKKVAKAQGVMIINGNELVQKLDKYFKGKYYNSNL